MATKRMNIELPIDQYEFLKKEAALKGTTITGLIRQLIKEYRAGLGEEVKDTYFRDSLFQREGSFNGPPDLAQCHDRYLYGDKQ